MPSTDTREQEDRAYEIAHWIALEARVAEAADRSCEPVVVEGAKRIAALSSPEEHNYGRALAQAIEDRLETVTARESHRALWGALEDIRTLALRALRVAAPEERGEGGRLAAGVLSDVVRALWTLPGFSHANGNSVAEDVLDYAARLASPPAPAQEEETVGFTVAVEGDAPVVYDTPERAVAEAVRRVYLPSEHHADQVRLLKLGEIADWGHGFYGVAIYPPARWPSSLSAPAQKPTRTDAWLREYERRKLAFSEANWRCAEWDRNEDDDPYEARVAALESAEIALDRHVGAVSPVSEPLNDPDPDGLVVAYFAGGVDARRVLDAVLPAALEWRERYADLASEGRSPEREEAYGVAIRALFEALRPFPQPDGCETNRRYAGASSDPAPAPQPEEDFVERLMSESTTEQAQHTDEPWVAGERGDDIRAVLTRLYLAAHRAGVEAAADHLTLDLSASAELDAGREVLAEDARTDTEDEYSWTDAGSPLALALATLTVQGEPERPDAPALSRPVAGSEERDNPCADALDWLWRDIILARNPRYGDWEYPGMAYRHLLAEFNDLRTALHDAIERPQGVVPDGALRFYDPTLAALRGEEVSGG